MSNTRTIPGYTHRSGAVTRSSVTLADSEFMTHLA